MGCKCCCQLVVTALGVQGTRSNPSHMCDSVVKSKVWPVFAKQTVCSCLPIGRVPISERRPLQRCKGTHQDCLLPNASSIVACKLLHLFSDHVHRQLTGRLKKLLGPKHGAPPPAAPDCACPIKAVEMPVHEGQRRATETFVCFSPREHKLPACMQAASSYSRPRRICGSAIASCMRLSANCWPLIYLSAPRIDNCPAAKVLPPRFRRLPWIARRRWR